MTWLSLAFDRDLVGFLDVHAAHLRAGRAADQARRRKARNSEVVLCSTANSLSGPLPFAPTSTRQQKLLERRHDQEGESGP